MAIISGHVWHPSRIFIPLLANNNIFKVRYHTLMTIRSRVMRILILSFLAIFVGFLLKSKQFANLFRISYLKNISKGQYHKSMTSRCCVVEMLNFCFLGFALIDIF